MAVSSVHGGHRRRRGSFSWDFAGRRPIQTDHKNRWSVPRGTLCHRGSQVCSTPERKLSNLRQRYQDLSPQRHRDTEKVSRGSCSLVLFPLCLCASVVKSLFPSHPLQSCP